MEACNFHLLNRHLGTYCEPGTQMLCRDYCISQLDDPQDWCYYFHFTEEKTEPQGG